MRIMAVSDRVLDHLYSPDVGQKYPAIDLLIGCGDLPFYYLEFLLSALDTTLVYVRGNHDAGPQYTAEGRVLMDAQGGVDLHGRVVRVKDLLIAGLEGSMRYRPEAPHMYTEWEMTRNAGRLLPQLLWYRQRYGRSLDILVTHSPPWRIHDAQDIAHTGFKIFLTFMRLFRPRYLLHGHVHIYRNELPRITRYHETTIINVYPWQMFDYGTL
ncbi:MAG: metallophosphoesterase [Chloroflexi bacterium]|nr:metallophosphoesterase [Chloroflexota bacterium]MCI0577602.1 metallophosphoesterase [Chloroflexota bacterium]MCI0644178.1 metallophosphoesterase [Chloroflexota bacterium]MCI0725239.1 metallophosphoesterase [Chloroflexota bacterium]